MPGRRILARELGVSHNTVQGALDLLEREGILVAKGVGRRREIAGPKDGPGRIMRVGILLYELSDRKLDYTVDIRHALESAGHIAVFARKGLAELEMDVGRVKRLVEKTEVDAWVVYAASREVLEWFTEFNLPTFALFGRRRGLRIAGTGPDKISAMKESLHKLYDLGHRRIVMLAREERRKPYPGQFEQVFLDELEALGIPTGTYNLPDWEDDPSGLRHCLDSLFKHTPPTALIVQEALLFPAVQQHLAQRGLVAPRDISLVSCDCDPAYDWCQPPIAHIAWESEALARPIRRWVERLARGQDDRRQTFTKAEFIEGGTIGPVA